MKTDLPGKVFGTKEARFTEKRRTNQANIEGDVGLRLHLILVRCGHC